MMPKAKMVNRRMLPPANRSKKPKMPPALRLRKSSHRPMFENLVGIRLACRAGSRETHYIRSFAGGDGMHVPGAVRGPRRKIGLRESRPRGLVCAGQQDKSDPGRQHEISRK